jgi:glycosyltransferase involved in cell wall biosynthesis
LKNIIFVLKGYPRVSETFIAQEILLLEEQGYNITILSMRSPREPQRQPINSQIKAPIIYLPAFTKDNLGFAIKTFLLSLKKSPVETFYTFLSAAWDALKKESYTPLKRFIEACWFFTGPLNKMRKFKHIHSHFIHAPTELTLYIKQLSGLSYSISAHAKDIYTIDKKDIVKRILNSEFLTTCTRFNYEFLCNLDYRILSKIHLSYHGVDTTVFVPSTNQELFPSSTYNFVSVGRLVAKKGYANLLRGLKILKDQGMVFKYDIYGAGELESQLKNKVDELGLDKQVVFHLTATHPDIIKRFKSRGLFLCGSVVTADGDRDGIPNTIAEAMSMELPVLATEVSGIPELIVNNQSGYLIKDNSPQKVADKINEIVANKENAHQIGKNARKRVKEVFFSRDLIAHLDKLFVHYV